MSKARVDLPDPDRPEMTTKLVARDVEGDVLEVVVAGAAEGDWIGI
jgi:hypothetical protein